MKRIMKKKLITAIVIALMTSSSLFAEDKDSSLTQTPSSATENHLAGWLGITLDRVPSALSSQLSEIIPSGQGVLVVSVSHNSPAEKAGIKVNDVLLSVDGQKLYSAGQLSGLIRNTQPGSKVNFKAIQQGKVKDIPVVLGKRTIHPWQSNPLSLGNGSTPLNQMPQTKVFGSFESVQVRTLADGRYHAEVSYKNEANKTEQFTFEGKREEIIEQIKKHKTLPDDKKQSLINALNMNLGAGLGMPFSGSLFNHPFFNQPFFQGNNLWQGFNDPFFQNNLFNDPFFQNILPRLRIVPHPPLYPPRQQQLPINPYDNGGQRGSLI